MGKVPFSTVEVNNSIFKLISEEKEVCKSSLSCCFYKVHYLKIMNSEDYRNHEPLSEDTTKKESAHSKIVFRSFNKSPMKLQSFMKSHVAVLVNRPRQGPKYNQLFQGHSTCVQEWVTALSFFTPLLVIALLAGIGKNQAHLALVSSCQREGSLSNKWQGWWESSLGSSTLLLPLQVHSF